MANSLGIDAKRITSISLPDSFMPVVETSIDNFIRYHVLAEFYDNTGTLLIQ